MKKDRDIIIGDYLVIAELNGTGNVYEGEGHSNHVHNAPTFKAACRWAREAMGEDPSDDDEEDEEEPAVSAPKSTAPERQAQKKPCNQCPFRRKAMAGWLGESTPEGFIATILMDYEPLPCHSTVDYNRPDWHARWMSGRDKKAKLCAGALTIAANTGRKPHFGHATADKEAVFATFAEFIEHHRGSRVYSWVDPEPKTMERHSLDNVRKHAGLQTLNEREPTVVRNGCTLRGARARAR